MDTSHACTDALLSTHTLTTHSHTTSAHTNTQTRRQGALQFSFGPPPDTEGKQYAIETHLPPVHMGGPSVEELQDGMVQLVPGTYQFVFDQE